MADDFTTETLEVLVIELIGDDKDLRAKLDESVRAAEAAAEQVATTWANANTRAAASAKSAAAAVDLGDGLAHTQTVIDNMATTLEDTFRRVAASGEKTKEEFESMRREALAGVDALKNLAEENGLNADKVNQLKDTMLNLAATYREVDQSAKRTSTTTDELKERIADLTNKVAVERNQWVNRVKTSDEFRASTIKLRDELLELAKSGDLTSKQLRQVTQAAAYATRGIDSANGVASRGGLAWTTQIALTNQFGQTLRGLGPAGGAAASAMGIAAGAVKSLQQPVTMADVSFRGLATTLARFALVIAPMAQAIALLTAGTGLTKLALDAAEYATELTTATYRTGLAAEALQELQHAATITGVPLQTLENGLTKLQQSAGEAASGNKTLATTFQALGVPLRASSGELRTTEELLTDVAEGLSQVENNTTRVQAAIRIFGKEGGRLLPLLSEGKDGIAKLRQEARDLGLVVSGETVLSLTQFQAEVDTLKKRFQIAKVEIGAAFMPLVRDILLPLLNDKAIPIIQGVADKVQEFAGTLFDASEQGDQLRERVIATLTPLGRIAATAIAFGQGVYVGLQTITVAIRLLIVNTQIAWEEFRSSFANMKLPANWQEALGIPGLIPQQQSGGRGTALDYLRAERDRIANESLTLLEDITEPLRTALDAAFGDLIPETLRNLLGALVAPGATRAANEAGKGIGIELTNGVREALEGSLRHAQQQVQHALEERDFAITTDDQDKWWAEAQKWQKIADAILERFAEVDPAAAAKLWVSRLTAELELQMKTQAQALDLLSPVFKRLQDEAAEALAGFGIDSTEYKAAVARLEAIDGLLKQIRGTAVTLETPAPIATLTPAAEAAAAYAATLADAAREAVTTAKAFDILGDIGVSLRDRMAFLEGSPWAAALMTGPSLADAVKLAVQPIAQVTDRVSELRTIIQAMLERGEEEPAILSALNELLTLTPLTVKQIDELTKGWYTARTGFLAYADILDERGRVIPELLSRLKPSNLTAAQAFEEFPTLEPVIATLTARLNPALKDADALAAALGQSFDNLGARQSILSGIVEELTSRFKDLTPGELAVLAQAAAALNEIEAAQKGAELSAMFDAWVQGVGRLGLALDPVDQAAVDLADLLSQGAITAAQYAEGIDLLADAAERLAKAEADAAEKARLQKLTDDWKTAADGIRGYLHVAQVDLAELRDLAATAFAAGIISAEQYADALRAINFQQLTGNLDILAGKLNDAARILPAFASGVMQAMAQLAAGNRTDAIATAFQALNTAVTSLKGAFEDTANAGDAAFDLIVGGAAAVATIIGGPALGQAVGAVGQFVKSIFGDMTNGALAIRDAIEETAKSSRYLGEGIIEGIAAANTKVVSRGGILGLLGFTKPELDEEGYRAGVQIAEGLADGLVGTLRASDFDQAWKSMVDDILIDGMIDRFLRSQAVQDAIASALNSIDYYGDQRAVAGIFDRIREDFRGVWEAIQEIIGDGLDKRIREITSTLANSIASAMDSTTADEAWDKATRGFKDLLRQRLIEAVVEGAVLKPILDAVSQGVIDALADGVITEDEYARLEALFGETEGPLRDLWDALDRLGLGFEDLNDVVNDVTASLSNVPQVFKIAQATMDAIYTGSGGRNVYGIPITTPRDPDDRLTVNFNAPVYGLSDFEDHVRQAVAAGDRRAALASFGTTARFA